MSGQINPNIKIQKAKIKVNGEEIEGNLDLSKVIMPLEYYEALNKGNINEALEIRNDFLVKRQLIDKKKSEKKEIEIEKVNIDQERFDNAKKSHNDKIKKAIEDTELPDERKKRGLFSRISEMFRRPQFDPKYAFDICSNETKEKIRKLDPDKVDDCIKAAELADISIDYAEEFLARYGKTGYQTICETLGDENKKISEQDIKEAIIDKGCEDEYNNEINEFDRIVEMIEARYGHKNEDQTIEINEKIERIYKSLSKKEIKKLKKEGILSKKAADQIREKIINPENEKRYLIQKERVEYVRQAIKEKRGDLGYTIIERNNDRDTFQERIRVEETLTVTKTPTAEETQEKVEGTQETVAEIQEQSEIPEYQIIYNQLTDGNEGMKEQIMQCYDYFKKDKFKYIDYYLVESACKELAKKRNKIELYDNGEKSREDYEYYCRKASEFFNNKTELIETSDEISDKDKKSMKICEEFRKEKNGGNIWYNDILRIAINLGYINEEQWEQYNKLKEDAEEICKQIFDNICAKQGQNEFSNSNYDGSYSSSYNGSYDGSYSSSYNGNYDGNYGDDGNYNGNGEYRDTSKKIKEFFDLLYTDSDDGHDGH